MKSPDNLVFRVGAWRVDPALDELYKGNETVKLEPRTMRLLVCLAEHAGSVVSVDQLLERVWKDVVVTPNSVYHGVAMLRRILGDDAKNPTYIANTLRRGYRLVAPVAPWVDAQSAQSTDSAAAAVRANNSPSANSTASVLVRRPYRSITAWR